MTDDNDIIQAMQDARRWLDQMEAGLRTIAKGRYGPHRGNISETVKCNYCGMASVYAEDEEQHAARCPGKIANEVLKGGKGNE